MITLNKRLETLTQQIIRAKIYYDLWWFSAGAQTRPQIVDTLNDFPDFFRFDEHSHFVSMIVHSAVVWDKTSQTISLPSLARDVLDESRFPEHASIMSNISQMETAACGILAIRHGAIAHRSGLNDYHKVFEDARVVPDRLPVMMSDWLATTNRLRQIRSLAKEEFSDLPLRDLRAVILTLGGPDLQ